MPQTLNARGHSQFHNREKIMDKTVPKGAAILLDFIRKTEVGTDARAGYDVIYGHNQTKLAKPVTQMTLAEIQAAQAKWSKNYGSSATGGYQFMRATLKGLISELRLSTSQVLDPDLQDRLGYHLLKRRGYEAWVAGRIGDVEFAKRLAMEWASFPVLENTTGAHRSISRGQSYYAGDGLNKALISPAQVESLLARADAATTTPVLPQPAPKPAPTVETPPTASPDPSTGNALVKVLAVLLAGGLAAAAKFLGFI